MSLLSRFEELDRLLAEKAPVVHGALRPGLRYAQVEEMTHRHGLPLPAEVAALYTWHDGADLVDETDRAHLFPGAQMLPLTEALARRSDGIKADRLHDPPGWQSDWMPLFVGYQWKYWVVACGDPKLPVLTFDWIDLPETWLAYPSLETMLDSVSRCWSTGAYWEGPDATVEEDRRAVARINRETDVAPVDVEQLVHQLDSGEGHAFSNALGQLRTRLYPEAVPALVKMLDTQSEARIAAIELLGAIGGEVAAEKLRRVAEDYPDSLIRDYARNALTEMRS